ncbi:redoxin domain-containing protein [Chitinophaga pendula]|uniref:redoxin domain-containing protein n=1 Tax=Chitinophaga TaxID=79328 RepID=UPI0012FD6365|nr:MULTISPECIES: redoxin domain-containing protein [Chitinophaga]UCJ07932.1 redoxin domain-containing protein [Chitinophaga pendula]
MRLLLTIALLCPTWLCSAQTFREAAVRRFALRDTSGRIQPLRPPAGKLLAVLFLSPECPLCKSYAPVLRKLQEQFAEQVYFVGIIPGEGYSLDLIRQYQADYHLPFPLLQDKGKQLSGYLQARVTPEAMLFDPQGHLLYRGLIDNGVVSLGARRTVITARYLEAAILQKEHTATTHTKAIGCLINID